MRKPKAKAHERVSVQEWEKENWRRRRAGGGEYPIREIAARRIEEEAIPRSHERGQSIAGKRKKTSSAWIALVLMCSIYRMA